MKYPMTCAVAAVVLGAAAGSARAGLEICNESGEFRTVAVGYMGTDDWTSEGWWLLEDGACATPVSGDLTQRYYYLRAETQSGDYAEAGGYTFCTETDAFTIVGDTECESRGYLLSDFSEIDTGETATHHVETILASVAPDTGGGAKPPDGGTTAPVISDADGADAADDGELPSLDLGADVPSGDAGELNFGSETEFGVAEAPAIEPMPEADVDDGSGGVESDTGFGEEMDFGRGGGSSNQRSNASRL